RRQPDVELEAERAGDLVCDDRARRPPRDAGDDLADEPPVGDRVVAVVGARLPQRTLPRQQRDGPLPAHDVVERDELVQCGQPGPRGLESPLALPPHLLHGARVGLPACPRSTSRCPTPPSPRRCCCTLTPRWAATATTTWSARSTRRCRRRGWPRPGSTSRRR